MADWRPSFSVETLRKRAAVLAAVRRFFAERDVLEVQTPVIGRHTVTDPAIDSLRTEDGRYLQTSPEYHMKRLLAAGAPSIFQIGPVVRRGEAGRRHNPEFTMIEWYRLAFDAELLMDEVAALVDVVLGPARYRRTTYANLLEDRFAVDVTTADQDAIVVIARGLGFSDDAGLDDALDLLLAEALASVDAERLFVTEFPPALAALARIDDQTGLARRFELVVDGVEVANGYHELTDADELAERMAVDRRHRRERDLPDVEPDEMLLAAQRHGLPDCAGVAVGLDRLLALKLGHDTVAETMAFAWQRA